MELTEGVRAQAAADAALLARARSGDADAFGMLVAARVSQMLRLARAILRNEADARDVVQEAFISAWQHLPQLRDETRFDAWLHTVVANRSRDVLRRRGRVREIAIDGIDLRQADPAPDALERAAVLAAFDRLPLADRHILAIHHLEGRTVEQIARALSIPVGTAKSRLYAARRALERALEAQA
jgi:RNA polymerase sigma-70 factor (ECF subfamily)